MRWEMTLSNLALSNLVLSNLVLSKLALTKLARRCVVLPFPSLVSADRTWSSLNNSRTPSVPQHFACGSQADYHAMHSLIVVVRPNISNRTE